MQCAQCQAENREGRRFCAKCGAPLALPCGSCGFTNEPGEDFCGGCGAALATAQRPVQSAVSTPFPGFTAPQSYTPQHLAERIISSRAALEGERKQVTVLFADLKGSMELLADRDPEEARRILDPVLERMMDAVHRYEGTVNQVMGDGIMALFGAPLAHEDHAVRACYAALRMQEMVKGYAQGVQRTEGLAIHIRVGLNSGEVVVRSVSSHLRMDYTAVGQTTHLAARMEQMAMPGSILLAPDTVQLAEGYVQVKALGPMAVKGLSGPIEVCELLGAGTARSRLQAAAARGLTKFVGRDAELETLRRTLEQAGAGHGQLIALVGEPGVGKSRLLWEFSHSHRAQGWLVLESGSVSYGKATAYLPLIDLLKTYCGIEGRDDAQRIHEKLTGKLLTLDPALGPTLHAFLSLLDVPVDDPAWQALDPPQRRHRTLDACKRLFLRESQRQPLLLVFEDLHWIDAETQALLDGMVDSLPAARVLLLVNYRPEYEHAWHRKTYYQQLRLDPLPPDSAEELQAALLGKVAELEPLKLALIERTEGNPFFIEESIRTLVENGVLAGQPGSYRLVRPFDRTQVPATVQAVLAARIDRLAPEDKRLLQAASVIGKDVPYALLQAVAETNEAALQQGLARLQDAEFLYQTSVFPEPEYTFKHALTHEVAYGGLLQGRRVALHARIVAAIQALYPDRQAEQIERLAHHAFRGELWEQAVAYLRQAGARAEVRSAYREAFAAFEQALAALRHLPDSLQTRALAIDIRIEMRIGMTTLDVAGRMLESLREAEALAEALDDPRRLGAVSATLTRCLVNLGEYAPAVEYGQRALAIATAIGDRAMEVVTRFRLGLAYCRLGAYREARDVLTRNVELLTGDLATKRFGVLITSVGSLGMLTECLAELGEFAEAAARGKDAVAIAEAVEHPHSLGFAVLNLGKSHLIRGDFDQAIALFERGVSIFQGWQLYGLTSDGAGYLGYAYALSGRTGDTVPMLERAAENAAYAIDTDAVRTQVHHIDFAAASGHLARLAEAYLLAGRGDEAARTVWRALSSARDHKERGAEAWTLRLQGEIAARADPAAVEQAERSYHQALALAEELGMRPLVAHCHLGLGTLYRKIGRDEQAQAELATAAEMYRAMEMTSWLARAETELGQIASVP